MMEYSPSYLRDVQELHAHEEKMDGLVGYRSARAPPPAPALAQGLLRCLLHEVGKDLVVGNWEVGVFLRSDRRIQVEGHLRHGEKLTQRTQWHQLRRACQSVQMSPVRI